jgi:hypothetical protein
MMGNRLWFMTLCIPLNDYAKVQKIIETTKFSGKKSA